MKINGVDYGYCPGYRKEPWQRVQDATGGPVDSIVIKEVHYPIVGLPLAGAPGAATGGVVVKRLRDDHPRLAVRNGEKWQFVGLPPVAVPFRGGKEE